MKREVVSELASF